MIRSVLTLWPAAHKAAELESLYARQGILERARQFPGCRDAHLLRPVQGSAGPYLVIADWDGAADYQAWLDDPWRAEVSHQLAALLDTDPSEPIVGGVFELVLER